MNCGALDWRSITWERFSDPPVFFQTQRPYYKIPCRAKSTMRVVIVMRNIWEHQKSVFYHYGFEDKTETLFKGSGHIERAIGK